MGRMLCQCGVHQGVHGTTRGVQLQCYKLPPYLFQTGPTFGVVPPPSTTITFPPPDTSVRPFSPPPPAPSHLPYLPIMVLLPSKSIDGATVLSIEFTVRY